MATLPARGRAVRELGLRLPPTWMPPWRHGRPLKRWRYVGVYTRELMLCVGAARIGPAPRRWWAVAEPDGTVRGKGSTRRSGVGLAGQRVRVESADAFIDLELGDAEGVETASPVAGGNYVWTRKRAGVDVTGVAIVGDREHTIAGPHGFSDESAGYHARHTAWRWSAGVGRTADGRRLAWNLVSGIHDGPSASERTLWIDGRPREVGPVQFEPDLSGLSFADGGRLRFAQWGAWEERLDLLLVRSAYRQPFGTFAGELPGGLALAEGYGVMEDHDVWW